MANLALKRLTASDLTFFEQHFRAHPNMRQKGINLDANVLVRRLYPALTAVDGEVPLRLRLLGPGLFGEHVVQRKIVKSAGSKNWRLNGETIKVDADRGAPEERFRVLAAGDVAAVEFSGRPLPTSARLLLVANAEPADAALHRELLALLDQRSMVELTRDQFEQSVQRAAPVEDHPVHVLLWDGDLEDAAEHGQAGIERLLRRRATRRVTVDDLVNIRQNAERVGRQGEALINAHLMAERQAGRITLVRWASSENAIEPFDFETVLLDGTQVLIDVKSTEGEFERSFHVSLNELLHMASMTAPRRYNIYRVYQMGQELGRLRIATDVTGWARGLVGRLQALPGGVQVDSVSVPSNALAFGPEVEVQIGTGDDEEP